MSHGNADVRTIPNAGQEFRLDVLPSGNVGMIVPTGLVWPAAGWVSIENHWIL